MVQGRCSMSSWPKTTFRLAISPSQTSNSLIDVLELQIYEFRNVFVFSALCCCFLRRLRVKQWNCNCNEKKKTEDSNDLIRCLMDFFRFLIHFHRSFCVFNDFHIAYRIYQKRLRDIIATWISIAFYAAQVFDFDRQKILRVWINHQRNFSPIFRSCFVNWLIYDSILQEPYDHLD